MGTKERLTYVYGLLNEVIPGNVHYALYVTDNAEPPFIVYQELNKNPKVYADDSYLIKASDDSNHTCYQNKRYNN